MVLCVFELWSTQFVVPGVEEIEENGCEVHFAAGVNGGKDRGIIEQENGEEEEENEEEEDNEEEKEEIEEEEENEEDEEEFCDTFEVPPSPVSSYV